jgi:6-phosphogluconate dehydrogenase
MPQSDIGLIGLGVMGQSLARNFASHKIRISIYNRTTSDTTNFIKKYGDDHLIGHTSIREFVSRLSRPRNIILMVSAGTAVDAVISELRPLLDMGDTIIDCGNSHYRDTKRRAIELKTDKLNFIGCGVSGGEEGALLGPSMMPGGSRTAWNRVKRYIEPIVARDFSGSPCVTYIGPDGAGHYVKMVHNGIEYAIMQMLAEVYHIYRNNYGLTPDEIADIFEEYNRGILASFLMEISVPILHKKEGRKYIIDTILDKAGSKGTGQWTTADALDRGVAVPSIAEALFARSISSRKTDRVALAKNYPRKIRKPFPKKEMIPLTEKALYAGIVSAFAQGIDLIRVASEEEGWHIDLSEVIRIWQGGCIIRAKILRDLYQSTSLHPTSHIFASPILEKKISSSMKYLRQLVSTSISSGVDVPALTASLSYFGEMSTARTSANFIQGLRDYFGAHTYERIDKKGSFHTNWNQNI